MCTYTQPVWFPVATHNPPTLLSKVPSQQEDVPEVHIIFHHFTETRMTYTTVCMRLGGLPDSGNRNRTCVCTFTLMSELNMIVMFWTVSWWGGMTVWINCAVLLLQFTHSSRRIQANSLCPHIGLHLLYHPPLILSDPCRSICAAVVFKFTANTAVTLQRCVWLISFWAIERINWGIFSQILLSVNGGYN